MEKYESDPIFLDHFGTNADDLRLWMEETERQLRDLKFKYMHQVLSGSPANSPGSKRGNTQPSPETF